MRKNLVLVKSNPKEDKCKLVEVPINWDLDIGDTLLVVDPVYGKPVEVVCVSESFIVFDMDKFEDVCYLHNTSPAMVDRAIGYVDKEIDYFTNLDWDEETAEEINKPLPDDPPDKSEEPFDMDYEKQKMKDFAAVVAQTVQELGLEDYNITLKIGEDDGDD